LSAVAAHVVVTGAGGFIGGFVARRLAECGLRITAHTRQQSDLRAPGSLPEAFDALIHCANDMPPGATVASEIVYERNVEIARCVLERALGARARTVVNLSSMSAYGTVTADTVTEDLPPGELDAYGRAKRESEALLQACVARGLASGLSIRLPGTVGRGSHGNFLSVFLKRILAGEALQAKNPDALFNNVVYVGDLAGFLHAWISSPRPGHAVTNLGASEPLPMREVLSLLFKLSGREERVTFESGGKKPFLVSLERARALGYRPATVKASLENFVRDCL
jgi:nucleoside-diphosphate-sugar epimerase